MKLSLIVSFLLISIACAGKINGPVKAIYIDFQGFNWGHPALTIKDMADSGYNLIILAFKCGYGPADFAQAFAGETEADRKAAIEYAHYKGAKVLVSAGGATDTPYGLSAAEYGQSAAEFARKNFLDGVDFDMENFSKGLKAVGKTSEATIQWLVDATNAARKTLGNDAIITHAPQAPYFGKIGGGAGTNPWTQTAGGYTAVYKQAPHIDYFLVQFYNQGATCYTNYKGLFENSSDCPEFPGTSVKEIVGYGIPLEKIVVGKPVREKDGNNGRIEPAQLNTIFKQARLMGWNTGVMGWMWYGKEAAQWIQQIYPGSTNTPITTPIVAPKAPAAKPVQGAVTPKPVVNETASKPAAVAPVVKPVVAAPQPAKPITQSKPVVEVTAPKPEVAAVQPQKPQQAAATQKATPTAQAAGRSCVSADPAKATDAWCKSVNCMTTYVKSGLCKLV